jgi:hypothetical protein
MANRNFTITIAVNQSPAEVSAAINIVGSRRFYQSTFLSKGVLS